MRIAECGLRNKNGKDTGAASKGVIVAALWLACLSGFSGCTFLKVSIVEEAQPLVENKIGGTGKDKVLLMDITGIITSAEGGPALGDKKKPRLLARVREELDRARRDGRVKAVVVRINSPGGGVTASDTLHHELRKFRQETGVRIVAHIMDVGASGAYYAALAADRILAQPTSVTGSIGVILYRFDASGLMQKIGIQAQEISTGELKSIGSPLRPLSAGEKKIFQGVVDSLFDRFVALVAESRGLAPDAARALADGRIFTSQEARAAGLIDGIGYLDDAVGEAKKLSGLEDATVISYFRPGDYRPTIYSMNLINLDLADFPGPGFLYLWWP